MTGIFLPPQFQLAFGRIVYESVVGVARARETRSFTSWSLSFVMNAPRMTGTSCTPAQNWLQHVSALLKPATPCSSPNTTTLLVLRPAVVFGTDLNGAAAGVPAALGLPAALPATISTTRAAPAKSQTEARTLEAPIVRPAR